MSIIDSFRKKPADRHAEAVAKLAEWRESLTNLEAQLAAIEAQPPESPAQVTEQAEQWSKLTQSAKMTAAAIAAAETEVEQAARAVALAEADALDAPIRKLEDQVAKFDAKTAELQNQMEAHTGRAWQPTPPPPHDVAYIGGAPKLSRPSPGAKRHSEQVAEIRALREQQRVLRLQAEGEPDPVAEAAQRAAERAEAIRQRDERLEAAQVELDEIAARFNIKAGELTPAINEFYATPTSQVEQAAREASYDPAREEALRRVGEIADHRSFMGLVRHFGKLRETEWAAGEADGLQIEAERQKDLTSAEQPVA